MHELGTGCGMVGELGSGDGNEGNHERIDAEGNELTGGGEEPFGGVSKSCEEVGADLAMTKDRDCCFEGFEIGSDRDFGFAGHDALADGFVPSFEVHAEAVDTAVL